MLSIFLASQIYANEFKVGFAELSITPELIDEWEDVNNDAQFDPDIDKWTDVNGNNQFDAVWMAGFQNKRAAQGVKDDLMAVTAVIDDGQTRIGIISADTIGLMRKFVLSVREDVPAEWGLDYIMVHATHNHEGPDTQGLWGGLLVLGNAPCSFEGDVDEAQIEGIPADDTFGLYGGNDPSDNSGVIRYVSVRHGGAVIGENNEINGITLGGVGNGTVIENIEVVANSDDGIEFFGGTVNVTNALVWACGDDLIDIDQAYSGTVSNAIVLAGANSDHGMEIDGPEGSFEDQFVLIILHLLEIQ